MSISEVYKGGAVDEGVSKIYLGDTLAYERSGGGGYDDATQALLDEATTDGYTAASGSVLTALDTFITTLKSDGVWALLDAIWLPATNGDSDFATYNLKDPDSYQLTKVNSPTFTSLQGFSTDGSSSYLNTNFNPSTNGVNLSLNAASIGVYMRINNAGGNFNTPIRARS